MVEKNIINIEEDNIFEKNSDDYNNIYTFTNEVLERMKLDNIPSTPNNYKVYFQKVLLEKDDLEFRKSISILEIRENQEETQQILKHEQKISELGKLSTDIIRNIKSIYKKTHYLIQIITKSEIESKALLNKNSITIFFEKLSKTIKQIEKSLNRDMQSLKVLYSENVKTIKELDNEQIFDLDYLVYKKEYFLSKVQQELDNCKKFNFDSYIMLVRLNKKTIDNLKDPKDLEKANKFFAKILLNKFRKDDILGHIGNGVFGIIISNINDIEIKNVAIKFTNILNHSAMYLKDDYFELNCVITISKLSGDSYIKTVSRTMDNMDKIYEQNIPYFIDS